MDNNVPIVDIKNLVDHLYDAESGIILTSVDGDDDPIIASIERVAEWLQTEKV